MKHTIALVLALMLVGCGDDGEQKPEPDAGKPTCTVEQSKKYVTTDGLSKLLATAADQGSKEVLKSMVAEQCCKPCPKSSATDRPLVADMETCVKCASNYTGGNPATHISSCTSKVCKSQ